MKRFFIFLLFVSATLFSAVCPAAAADPVVNIGGVRIRKVLFAVSPADRQECMRNKESWGLKHCLSGGRDYLAGAAKACGGLQNLPTGKEAKELAVLLAAFSASPFPSARFLRENGTWRKWTKPRDSVSKETPWNGDSGGI